MLALVLSVHMYLIMQCSILLPNPRMLPHLAITIRPELVAPKESQDLARNGSKVLF